VGLSQRGDTQLQGVLQEKETASLPAVQDVVEKEIEEVVEAALAPPVEVRTAVHPSPSSSC
jgi:hypothetical protein